MFKVYYKNNYQIVTVYAVDFRVDSFLVFINGEFKWMHMKHFEAIDEGY